MVTRHWILSVATVAARGQLSPFGAALATTVVKFNDPGLDELRI